MNCPNCNAKMSCSCQKRVASDGKQVCSTCKASYEIKIKSPKSSNHLGSNQHGSVLSVSVLFSNP